MWLPASSRWPVICGGTLLVCAGALGGQAPADAPAEALRMFAEARAGIAAEPVVSQPEYYAYLAHQEDAAGYSGLANADLAIAFARALALPDAGFAGGVKREVEPDVVGSLIADGNLAQAAKLAATADVARSMIVDELIPALLERGDDAGAWAAWADYNPAPGEFAFHAADLLLGKPLSAAQKGAVSREAWAAAPSVANMADAEEAMDYLEDRVKADGGDTGYEAAVRGLAAAIPKLPGAAAWEIEQLRQRAAKLAGLAPEDSAAAAPLAPAAAPWRTAPADAMPFTPDRALALQVQFLNFIPDDLNEPPLGRSGGRTPYVAPPPARSLADFPPELAMEAPSYALTVAHYFYDHGRMDDFHGMLTRALRGADAAAAGPKSPEQINFNNVELWVYGKGAQMDFATTRAHVEALPAGWLKPLALAYVARMAAPAAANRPGKFLQVYH